MHVLLFLGLMVSAVNEDPDRLMSMAAAPWVVIDDGVMGGRSRGSAEMVDNTLVFSGMLSLENNGGFSSIRLPLNQSLSGYGGIAMEVRGDGRRYQLRLRRGRQFDGVAWRADFEAGREWQRVELTFDQFQPGFRGRRVPQAGPVVADEIRQVGILLGDKTPGPFRLEVRDLRGIAEPDGI